MVAIAQQLSTLDVLQNDVDELREEIERVSDRIARQSENDREDMRNSGGGGNGGGGSGIALTDISETIPGIAYENTTGVFRLTAGY